MPNLIRTTELIPVKDEKNIPAYLTRPENPRPRPALVFIFEIFGATREMKRLADEFAAEGYAVLMPDLFSRGNWFSCVRSVMQDLRSGAGQGIDDILAARAWLAQSSFADPEHIGIIGFCMGGAFALLLSKTGLFRVAAPFYGRAPERLDGACPIVAAYGARDKLTAHYFDTISAETRRLNIPNDLKLYPEAGHSFMNRAPNAVLGLLGRLSPLNASYDPAVAADAKNRVVAFLRRHL